MVKEAKLSWFLRIWALVLGASEVVPIGSIGEEQFRKALDLFWERHPALFPTDSADSTKHLVISEYLQAYKGEGGEKGKLDEQPVLAFVRRLDPETADLYFKLGKEFAKILAEVQAKTPTEVAK